ncbi:hypothetical protein Tco_1304751 [Tanacetum coccineum]
MMRCGHSEPLIRLLIDEPYKLGLWGKSVVNYQLELEHKAIYWALKHAQLRSHKRGRDHRTDKTKITRKPSKTGKHGHGKRKSTKEARDAKPRAGSKDAIVMKISLGALGQRSNIRLLFTRPHIVDLGDILSLDGLLLMAMVVSG